MNTRKAIVPSTLLALLAFTAAALLGSCSEPVETTLHVGNVYLAGERDFGHFDPVWDLTACDMRMRFTYDANGLVDSDGAQTWSLFGVRQVDFPDAAPLEGSGVWLAADYEWAAGTLAPDPVDAPAFDIDDRLILQKALGEGEAAYDLPSIPSNDWANHAVWFDRDGVAPSQAGMWGFIKGGTYSTGGSYEVVIDLKASGPNTGEAYLTVNGESQGFYEPAWHPGPPDLLPAGLTFTGDLSRMQVFYLLNSLGQGNSVAFREIYISGCLASRQVAQTR